MKLQPTNAMREKDIASYRSPIQPRSASPVPAAQVDYPHYTIAAAIYSLLQTALNVAILYERFPGADERQKLISIATDAYECNCNELMSRSSKQPGKTEAIPRQPLAFPSPHYSAQTSVYALLLAALNVAEHYENYPGLEARQKLIESAVKGYQITCDALKIKT